MGTADVVTIGGRPPAERLWRANGTTKPGLPATVSGRPITKLPVRRAASTTGAFPSFTAPNTTTIVNDAIAAGVETNATGSVYNVTSTGGGTSFIVYQTISGVPGTQQVNIPSNTKSKRLTWIEQR